MNNLIEKVIQNYEEAEGVLVSKKINSEFSICDTDYTSIWRENGILYFEFDEDEVEDFNIKIEDITRISFDEISNTIISIIVLTNGDYVSIHNL